MKAIPLGLANPAPVVACVNVYNDAQFLEKCLKSLSDRVDRIVVVDGAYDAFPHNVPWSTDGTVEIAKQYADIVVAVKAAWRDETVKRNYYLQFVEEGEYWLRVDADEELAGRIPQPLRELAYSIMLERTDKVKPYPILCLYRRTPESYYYGAHHAVWNGSGLLLKFDFPILDGVKLVHWNPDRVRDRVEARGVYQRSCAVTEKGFRDTFHV